MAEAKKFSLLIQEKNVNVIKLLNAVESIKSNYEQLLKKIQVSNNYILTLSNFKIIIDAVESNEHEDGKPLYQGHKLMNYLRAKCYLLDHAQASVMATFLVRMKTSMSTSTNVTRFWSRFVTISTILYIL